MQIQHIKNTDFFRGLFFTQPPSTPLSVRDRWTRNSTFADYRYGFQGYESDDEVKGEGNSYTTHFRQYDSRVAKWLSIDPKRSAWESPYVSLSNSPLYKTDQLGDTAIVIVNTEGAGGRGHLGALYQDKEGAWHYFSQGGGAGSSGSESGSGSFGHSSAASSDKASGSHSGSSETEAVVTNIKLTTEGEDGKLRNMTQEEAIAYAEEQGYNKHYVIPTSKKQDKIIADNAKKSEKAHNKDGKNYNVVSNNCSDQVQSIIKGTGGSSYTGVWLPADTWTPNGYFEDLQNADRTYYIDNVPVDNWGLDETSYPKVHVAVPANTSNP